MSDVVVHPAAEAGSPRREAGAAALRYARYVFWLMFLINFINYADRWVFSALANQFKEAFHFDDFQIGILSSAFLIVYTLVAFPTGYIADRVGRKAIVAAGVALWSLATILTVFAGSFLVMLGVRSLVGVGEGSYYPAGTALLSAFFPSKERTSIMARWGAGALVGAGVGFLLAGALAGGNWRLAFFITGIPGFVLAFLLWRIKEKARHEDDPVEQATPSGTIFSNAARYLRIRTLRVILAMHALGFFALTAIASFLVIYFGAIYGNSPLTNGDKTYPAPYPEGGLGSGLVALIPGVILLLGGISGTFAGSALSNRLARRRPGARVLASGIGFLAAAPCLAVVLLLPKILGAVPSYASAAPGTQVTIGVAIFVLIGTLTAFTLNFYNGPSTAALQEIVPPSDRAASGGLELTLAHLLGDIYSPAVVGALAALLSSRRGGEQIGLALLLTCPAALLAAGIVSVWGSRFYAADVAAVDRGL